MPTDTQRAPMPETALARVVREEREAVADASSGWDAVEAARAATDDAVAKVEGASEALAECLNVITNGSAPAEDLFGARVYDPPYVLATAVDRWRAALDAITPAPIAQGDTTGGASDE